MGTGQRAYCMEVGETTIRKNLVYEIKTTWIVN
jgi:hypothetical protein